MSFFLVGIILSSASPRQRCSASHEEKAWRKTHKEKHEEKREENACIKSMKKNIKKKHYDNAWWKSMKEKLAEKNMKKSIGEQIIPIDY